MARHFSAFSPLSAADLPSTVGGSGAMQTQPLDLMLIQMQMATTAAAGLLPAPFNLFSSAAALGLLAPQFGLSQLNPPFPSSNVNNGFEPTVSVANVTPDITDTAAGSSLFQVI